MGKVHKAIIPAGGRGTRLSPLSRFYPKELLAIGGKPALQRVIEEAVQAGITDIAIITREGKPAIEQYFSLEGLPEKPQNAFEDYLRRLLEACALTFLHQPEPLGLGDAISQAGDFIGGEPFAMLLPDNLFSTNEPVIGKMVEVFDQLGGSIIATKLLITATDANVPKNEAPMAYTAVSDDVVQLDQIGDKGAPRFPAEKALSGDLRGIGRGVFSPEYLAEIEALRGKHTGELDDVRPLRTLLATQKAYGYIARQQHFDVGDFPGYIRAQRHFLPVDTENQHYTT